jgi:hypothetical protein
VKPFTEGPVGPGWKLGWEDAVFRDPRIRSWGALKVAAAIRSRVDSFGIVKNMTYPWIASWAKISVRAAGEGCRLLVECGHVEILKASRGRGQANEMRIVRQQPPESLPQLAGQSPESLPQLAGQSPESRQASVQKQASQRSKGYAGLPTLPLSLPILSSLGRNADVPLEAAAQICAGSLEQCWEVVLARLAEPNRLGKARVQSWLANGRVGVGGFENGELTIFAESKHETSYNEAHHGAAILREWQLLDPSILHLKFKHGPVRQPVVETPASKATPAEKPKVIPLRDRLKARATGAKTGPATG